MLWKTSAYVPVTQTAPLAAQILATAYFYKWLEAAIYSAAKENDTKILQKLDEYIDLIGRAQLPDGYISTKQILGERQNTGVKRFGNINDFEVYNFGHLFTAACLHKRCDRKG